MLLSFIVFVLYLSCEKNENKQKEAGFGPFKKHNYDPVVVVVVVDVIKRLFGVNLHFPKI